MKDVNDQTDVVRAFVFTKRRHPPVVVHRGLRIWVRGAPEQSGKEWHEDEKRKNWIKISPLKQSQ